MPKKAAKKPSRRARPKQPPADQLILNATIPLSITFPASVFMPSGAMEHRIHKSKTVSHLMQMGSVENASMLYDDLAKQCREQLIKAYPTLVWPEIENVGLIEIDTKDVERAAGETDGV